MFFKEFKSHDEIDQLSKDYVLTVSQAENIRDIDLETINGLFEMVYENNKISITVTERKDHEKRYS